MKTQLRELEVLGQKLKKSESYLCLLCVVLLAFTIMTIAFIWLSLVTYFISSSCSAI